MGLWKERLLLIAITAVTVLSLVLLAYCIIRGRS